MTEFNVVGVRYEGRDEILNDITEEYEDNGYDLDDLLKGIILLVKEPTNQYDPKAIKVYMKDLKNNKHHIGYIAKDDTEKVAELMKTTKRIDAWISRDHVSIDMVSIVENNPFIKQGDGTAKTKLTNRIGCGLMLFIVLIIIVIVIT